LSSATAVASAHDHAECELGIPPLLTMILKSSPFPCDTATSILINWANIHAQSGMIKTQLVIRSMNIYL